MYTFLKEHQRLIIGLNILISYAIYYGCALVLWQFVINSDIPYNEAYTYDADYYWSLSTLIILTIFIYMANVCQSVFLSIMYSRHFGCTSVIIHQFIFLYIWCMISYVTNDGCKHREWLQCYKNKTIVVNNMGLDESKTFSIYGMGLTLFLELICVITSYIKNRNKIYYFYRDCCREIVALISFYYCIAVMYALLPLIICLLMTGCNNVQNDSCANLSTPDYISGNNYHNTYNDDEEAQKRSSQISDDR